MWNFKSRWLFPMAVFQGYLTLCLVLFYWGPWGWEVNDPLRLTVYLLAAQIFILIGYILGWSRVSKGEFSSFDSVGGINYIDWCLLIALLLLIPTSLSRTGDFFPDVAAGLANSGSIYNENYERLEYGNPFVFVEYLRILFSVCLASVFPLTVVYWGRLNGWRKLLSVCVVATTLFTYIATGTNKGFADFVISVPFLIVLGVWSGNIKLKLSKTTLGVIFIIIFFAFLFFFGAGQKQRAGGVGEGGVFNTGSYLFEADRNNGLSKFLSGDSVIIYESLTRYLGQGYYALSMSFDLETASTFGFGNSMFFARNANSLFHTEYFTSESIPGVLEQETGWGMMSLWHSIYPWLASDFGFVGALLVLCFFSYIMSVSWGYSLKNRGALWVVMAYFMIILFFYIPANNQIFQTAETAVAFLLLFVKLFILNDRKLVLFGVKSIHLCRQLRAESRIGGDKQL